MDIGRFLKGFMDVYIVGIIAASATIVAATITGWFGMGQVKERIKGTRDLLNKDHNNLEKTINQGKELIIGSVEKTVNKIENINKLLAVEAKTKELLYQSLDKDQQEIKRHVEGINALTRNWEEVNARNKELEKRVRELEHEINKVKEKDRHMDLEC